MATQEERRAETRRRLLDAAAELFAERGVDAASIDAIAERADRTSGAVYDHFGGKDGLLFALLDGWVDDVAAVIGAELSTTTTLDERLGVLWRNVSSPVAGHGRWIALEHELHEGERLSAVETPHGVFLPLGRYTLSVGPLERQSGGRARVEVAVDQEDGTLLQLPVALRLASSGFVVVARQPIPAGKLLEPKDVAVERRPSTGIPRRALSDPEEVVGKRARIALEPGKALDHRSLESPMLVRRGDPVRIVVDHPGMRLSTVGRALENATAGSVVRVVNPSSGRELAAEVIAHGQVRVLR